MDGVLMPGPARDFVGYGPTPPDPRWPDDVDVAVNLVINYEEGAEYSMPDDGFNDSWGEYTFHFDPPLRDLGTEAHYEFGSRAGIWRICRVLDEFDVHATFNACGLALERNPPLCDWLRGRRHDILGHGYRWSGPDHGPGASWSRDDEREEIALGVASVERTTGQRVQGWMVRSFATVHTRELLVEDGGFLYDSDSTNDELPYFVEVLGRRHLVVPYTKVFNDTRYLINPTYASPRHFFENVKLGLDYMLAEAKRGHGGRMLSVGLHSRWSGQANRASAVRDIVEYVLETPRAGFMRRLDIAQHWIETHG
jgi:peptidoglycan/xylan/chitin deacetylase (PgdA/CDA1 family)